MTTAAHTYEDWWTHAYAKAAEGHEQELLAHG